MFLTYHPISVWPHSKWTHSFQKYKKNQVEGFLSLSVRFKLFEIWEILFFISNTDPDLPTNSFRIFSNSSTGNKAQVRQKKLFDRPSSKWINRKDKISILLFCWFKNKAKPLSRIKFKFGNTLWWVTKESKPLFSLSYLLHGYSWQSAQVSNSLLTAQHVKKPHAGCFSRKSFAPHPGQADSPRV